MTKVELLIDEIDYNDVAKLAIPIVKEKLFSKVAGIELDKFLPESMMNYATQKFLE